jgi:hypothetical protein
MADTRIPSMPATGTVPTLPTSPVAGLPAFSTATAMLERAGRHVSNGDSSADLFLGEGCSELLFTLHNQMTTINGLAEIAVESG